MKAKGRITAWDDDRGFGFIASGAGNERVFVHIKSFARTGRRPVVGDEVCYRVGKDDKGRLRAHRVRFRGAGQGDARTWPTGWMPYAFAAAFLLLLGAAAWARFIPRPFAYLYLGASVVTFVAYLLDKRAARRGAWRIPESRLHLLALGGGWPGALVARHLLRHKTRKKPFRRVFSATVLLNCAALAWLLTAQGKAALRSWLDGLG